MHRISWIRTKITKASRHKLRMLISRAHLLESGRQLAASWQPESGSQLYCSCSALVVELIFLGVWSNLTGTLLSMGQGYITDAAHLV
jgi:hypothetical protein